MTEAREPHQVALGRAIRQLREEAELTREQLAERTEIPGEELRLIEDGTVEANWGTLRQLAYGMKVELPDLFRLGEELERG